MIFIFLEKPANTAPSMFIKLQKINRVSIRIKKRKISLPAEDHFK
jgi:hypothetical protein